MAVVLAVVALLVATSGCVGKRGRNDDPVAPGSDGKARVELPQPIAPADATPR
jgi:hypothetical protein